MNLNGWDTCSIVSIDLVNQALAAHSDELIKTFKYRDTDMAVEGTFGPWRILDSSAERLVNVAMPIKSGKLRAPRPINIEGVTIYAQMKLRMIPDPKGTHQELRFDVAPAPTNSPMKPIMVYAIDDPKGKLDMLDEVSLQVMLTEALCAHADQVSYVFASVKARGTIKDNWLESTNHDWVFTNAGEGRQYLTLVGGERKRDPDVPFQLDPKLIAKKASCYFAASTALFCDRALAPALTSGFKPKSVFKAKGDAVQMTKAVSLGGARQGPIWVEPVLKGLTLTPKGGALHVRAVTKTDLPLKTSLDAIVDMRMPFYRDPKTGGLGFKRDPHPKITKKLSKSGIIGNTLGLIVELIVHILDKPINRVITSIARSMQALNNQTKTPIVWRGLRDFQTDAAAWDGCLWMADLRPTKTLMQKPMEVA